MATYTELTAEQCKSMLIDLLDLDPEATDQEIEAAYEEQKPDAAEAEPQDAGDAEGAGDSAATEPAEEQMPMKGSKSKFRGSAMTVLVRPKR